MRRPRSALPLALLIAAATLPAGRARADDDTAPTYAFGAGMQRLPAWMGSKDTRTEAIPYIDIEIPGMGELSTADGLMVDVIAGEHWHGGAYGNWLWGRSRHELRDLGGIVPSLSPRFQAGGYLEYAFTKRFTIGSHVAHDTDGAGAYAAVYADYQLPDVWYIQHSLELQVDGMNGPAMRRFFGVTPAAAATLATPSWQPGAGSNSAHLEYDAFVPTSQHTGFAVAIAYARLMGQAGNSPLVTTFGAKRQVTETLAFVYHF